MLLAPNKPSQSTANASASASVRSDSITTKYRARYAIIGAMIGDALGTTVEFRSRSEAAQVVAKYDNFSNGLVGLGPFNLLPGQFTDDTEMALAIMSVIVVNGRYDRKMVSAAYHEWYLSNPFDIGNTTRIAVSHNSLIGMDNAVRKYNSKSLSNGFLMRLFGLVGLYHDKSRHDLVYAVSEDVTLTHSHPETLHIAIIYSIMLHKAINGIDSNKIYYWGKKKCTSSPLLIAIFHAVENNTDGFVYDNHSYSIAQIDGTSCGFVGFAFWLLLRALKNHNSYRNAVIEIVNYGGDTDTNACITGAVMGALYPDTIPQNWIQSLIDCSAVGRYAKYSIADPKVWTKWLP